jgi:hypothetical protein
VFKTTLVTYENGGKQGIESPVLFYTPEAGAIVSIPETLN